MSNQDLIPQLVKLLMMAEAELVQGNEGIGQNSLSFFKN